MEMLGGLREVLADGLLPGGPIARTCSRTRPHDFITAASSGSAWSIAFMIALAFQTNMPEFQYQPPSFEERGGGGGVGLFLEALHLAGARAVALALM